MHWSDRPVAPPNSYPSGDGRPFSETDIHFDATTHLLQALDERYETDPDVYVSGNLLLYYEEGNGAGVSLRTCSWSSGFPHGPSS